MLSQAKAYTTRVGAGPYPTEIFGEVRPRCLSLLCARLLGMLCVPCTHWVAVRFLALALLAWWRAGARRPPRMPLPPRHPPPPAPYPLLTAPCFPPQLADELREIGAEYGTTTGRPRRIGWLDMVALKYAARINGLTHVNLTKLDVLSELEEIKVWGC